MKKSSTQHIGLAIQQYLHESGLERPLMERQVVEMWPKLMGELVANYTRKVELKKGTLYVHLTSAPLRQELFLVRFDLIKKLNEAIGATIVSDIRLL